MSRRHRLTGIIVCLIVITMTVIGCGSDNDNTPLNTQTPDVQATQTLTLTPSATTSPELTQPSDAETVVQRASDYLKDVTEYTLYRWVSSKKWMSSDKSDASVIDIYSNAELDLSDHNMEMSNIANVKTTGNMSGTVRDNKIYIIDDMLYCQGYYADSLMEWVKMSIDEDYWLLCNQAELIMELTEVSEKEIIKTEVLNIGNESIPCDVIQVAPEMEKLWEIIAQQPWIQLPLEPPEGFSFEQIINNAGMKVWLSQTAFVPVQAELSMTVQVGKEIVPTITDTVSMEVEVIMKIDYNQQITIELPSEAMSASNLDLQQSQ